MIPYGRQHLDDDDIAAVVDVLRGDWLTQGPNVAAFESALAEKVQARHAVAFANGTAALHAACAASGLGSGDLVATSPLTFVASANAARYVGADVGLVDVERDTWNLDLTAVPPGARAVVAVHYAGLPIDLSQLSPRPPVVIEDAAHALGASTPDGPVGNCAHSDLCCFSFHPVKAITTGEGGAVTTNDDDLAERLRRFRHHGITPTPQAGAWSYDITELSWNYRLTDLQAALGTSQLRHLDDFITARNQQAERYRELLDGTAVGLPPAARDGWRHAYHLFPVLVPDRRRVFDGLRDAGIGTQVHYVPLYRLSLHADDPARFPACESIYGRILSLPIHPSLSPEDQETVVEQLRTLL